MRSAEEVMRHLGTIAHDLRWLAFLWHLAIAAIVVAFVRGWRPRARHAMPLLLGPLASVAIVAAGYHRWLAALSFAVLGVAIALAGLRLGRRRPLRGPAWSVVLGAASITFGVTYPAFSGGWSHTLFFAPVGLLPAPTLAVLAGATLVSGGFGSRAIPALLGAWAAVHAGFGVLRLGMMIDLALVPPAIGLLCLGLGKRRTIAPAILVVHVVNGGGLDDLR